MDLDSLVFFFMDLFFFQVGAAMKGVWIGTYHSLCWRMLREHHDKLRLPADFAVASAQQQLRFIRELLGGGSDGVEGGSDGETDGVTEQRGGADEHFSAKRGGVGAGVSAAAGLQHILRWKERGLRPRDVPVTEATDACRRAARSLYAPYQRRLWQVGLFLCFFCCSNSSVARYI